MAHKIICDVCDQIVDKNGIIGREELVVELSEKKICMNIELGNMNKIIRTACQTTHTEIEHSALCWDCLLKNITRAVQERNGTA